MIPLSPYKPGTYPPSGGLYPRFGNAGGIPRQFGRGDAHLQKMIRRRAESQKQLADRAPEPPEPVAPVAPRVR